MAVVIKAFPCSFDGINSEWLEVGVERDFGQMTDGLRAAGYLAAADDVDPPAVVSAPLQAPDTPPPARRARGRK